MTFLGMGVFWITDSRTDEEHEEQARERRESEREFWKMMKMTTHKRTQGKAMDGHMHACHRQRSVIYGSSDESRKVNSAEAQKFQRAQWTRV